MFFSVQMFFSVRTEKSGSYSCLHGHVCMVMFACACLHVHVSMFMFACSCLHVLFACYKQCRKRLAVLITLGSTRQLDGIIVKAPPRFWRPVELQNSNEFLEAFWRYTAIHGW